MLVEITRVPLHRAETLRHCSADMRRMNETVRLRVLARWHDGLDTQAIATELGLHEATVYRLVATRPVAGRRGKYRTGE